MTLPPTSPDSPSDLPGTEATPEVPGHAHDGASARHMFSVLQERARAAGVSLRAAPPEPTTCCGRGCNGCVWEGFLAAAEYWREDALQQLA